MGTDDGDDHRRGQEVWCRAPEREMRIQADCPRKKKLGAIYFFTWIQRLRGSYPMAWAGPAEMLGRCAGAYKRPKNLFMCG